MTKRSFKQIHEIIVLATVFRDEVSNFSKSTKVWVLPNTSTLEGSQAEKEISYNGSFVCISNYIMSKGIYNLFSCFRQKDLAKLKIAFYGEKNDIALFMMLERSAPGNIELNGRLTREKLPGILTSFDCLVVPSWNEGQPLVILEAMSLGLPVIATNVGNIPDMLGKGYPFLAEPRDNESLAETILTFHNFGQKKQLAIDLRRRYLEKYSNKIYEEKLGNILLN